MDVFQYTLPAKQDCPFRFATSVVHCIHANLKTKLLPTCYRQFPESLWARLLTTIILLVACLLLLVMVAPQQAFAKSYEMPEVSIVAEAQTDGSLHVTETRTFDFDGDFTAVWWTFDGLPSNAALHINGARLTTPSDDGVSEATTVDLQSTPFQSAWRNEGGPGTNAYAFDLAQNTVYVFFHAVDEVLTITLDYTVEKGVQAYEDVAEVYWKYVSDQWEEASSNVSMMLTLPVPQGESVVAGTNVLAWGHGPFDGTVTINADGSVEYYVPRVNSGQFAEARVVFPVEWLTNLSGTAASTHSNEMRRDQILLEEQTWADQANQQRMVALWIVIACGVLCVLLLAWALWSYFKYGKEYRPTFSDEYWRDVPDPAVPPAVIGRLWRWDRESPNDFTATLMHLAHTGAIRIDKGSYIGPTGSMVDDYYLTRLAAAADVTEPLDRATLDFLFGTIAEGKDALWFGSIQKYGKNYPQEFVDQMASWQGLVSAETNKRDFFEFKSKRLQTRMIVVAVIVLVVGAIVFFALESFIPLLFMVPTAIALGVIANYMPRRSVYGNNLVAKCKALRNWLRDFSSLNERPPTDIKVWGAFMVYAYLFGIADQVIKKLRLSVPELFQDEEAYYGTSYVPWWFWYSTGYGMSGGIMPSVSDMMQTSLANTVSTAQAALSAAGDSFSSGGGFGGGFSMGGGGGFGGGGGAR